MQKHHWPIMISRTLQASAGVAGQEGTLQPNLAGLHLHLINRDHTTSSSRLSSFVFRLFSSFSHLNFHL
jgi:hypothetical protein